MNKINLDYKQYLKEMEETDVVILDPPWNFNNQDPKIITTTQYTKWENDKINLEELFLNLKCKIIFCWVPASYLPIFFEINLGSFSYKTCLSWVKLTKSKEIFTGNGFWFKNSCEYLMMFTVKNTKPLHSNIQTIIFEEVTKNANTTKPKKFESRLINNCYDIGYKKISYIFSGIFIDYDIPPGVDLDLIDIKFGEIT